MWLELPHSLITSILWCVCTHPSTLWVSTFYIMLMATSTQEPMMKFTIPLLSLRKMLASIWDENNDMRFEQLHALPSTMFNYSRWWIDIVLTKNGIHTLANVIIVDPTQAYLFPRSCTTQKFVASNAIQAKERNQHPIDQLRPFNNWSIWMSTQIGWCVFTRLCQCHLELERARRFHLFVLVFLFLLENFNHIAKYASIFHFKSGSNHRPNYFPASTLSGHTSHHHG